MSRNRVGDGAGLGRRSHATRSETPRDPVGSSAGPGRSECRPRSGAAFDPVRAHWSPGNKLKSHSFFNSRFFINIAGFPPTTIHGSTSLITTAPAATFISQSDVSHLSRSSQQYKFVDSQTVKPFPYDERSNVTHSWKELLPRYH